MSYLMTHTGYAPCCSLRRYKQAIKGLNASLEASQGGRELARIGSLIVSIVATYQEHDELAKMHLQSALTILESPDNPTAGGAQFLRDLARLLNSLTSLSRVNSKPLPSVIHHIATPRSSIEGYVRFRKYQRSTRLAELHQWRYPLPLSKRNTS